MALDSVYLTLFKNFFNQQIKSIQGSDLQLNLLAGFLCYVSLTLGLKYFGKTVLDAFLLGLFVYSVFELTNWTLFKQWNLTTVIVDSLWGGILLALTRFLTT